MTAEEHNRYDDFDALVRRNTRVIRAVCWRLASRDEAICDDLMQEVLLSLWRYRHTLRPEASESDEHNWVRWHCRSVWSHMVRRPSLPMQDLAALDELPGETNDCHELVEELAVNLDDRECRLLDLYFQGYNIAGAGRMMGLGRKNAYRIYRQMVKKMKNNLKTIENGKQ